MPLLLVGVGFLAFLLLAKREPTPAEKQKLANDIAADAVAKGNAIARQGQAEQGKGIASGVGLAVTGLGTAAGIVKGFIGAGAAAGGTAAATSTGTSVAVAGGTGAAAATGGASALSTVGAALGTSAAGAGGVIALAAVCAVAVFVAIGLAISSVLQALTDLPMAEAYGPQAIANGFNASMKRAFEKSVTIMQAKVPPAQWAPLQGYFRNVALLMSIHMHKKLNSLYRAGALANAWGIGATAQSHELYWANHGAFIPDFDAFADKFIAEMGAGSRASVINAATASIGADKLNQILLKAETSGKFLFYFTALTNVPILGVTDETYQVGWINRFCVSNPILQRWPIGAGSPFGIFGAKLGDALAAIRVGWNPADLWQLLNESWEMRPENLNVITGVYQENGLQINLTASAELKTPVIIDVGDPSTIAAQISNYYGVPV